jgi:hypothetical protein
MVVWFLSLFQTLGETLMGRASITIDKDVLQETIISCESKKEYKNQGELFNDVAIAYAIRVNKDKISPTWVYQRVQELSLNLKTPKGRIGRVAGQGPTGTRTPRSEKFAADPKALASLGTLKGEILREQGGKYLPVFKRLENGSLKAAIALKCLDCSSYQQNEIRHCACTSCPLFLVRPYQ